MTLNLEMASDKQEPCTGSACVAESLNEVPISEILGLLTCGAAAGGVMYAASGAEGAAGGFV